MADFKIWLSSREGKNLVEVAKDLIGAVSLFGAFYLIMLICWGLQGAS